MPRIEKLPSELREEISSGENLRVEFKESYQDNQKIRHTMMSFANAIGGRIYIGVEEISEKDGYKKGKIIGITQPALTKASSLVTNWANEFRPKINAILNVYKDDEKRIHVIEVTHSNEKPVCTSDGLYKIRTSDGNMGIDPALMREMVVGYQGIKSALLLECTRNLALIKG
ncbi:helix-turn-helix domain-containing protein, partial [Candidatus Latescibacterota bacterium]